MKYSNFYPWPISVLIAIKFVLFHVFRSDKNLTQILSRNNFLSNTLKILYFFYDS